MLIHKKISCKVKYTRRHKTAASKSFLIFSQKLQLIKGQLSSNHSLSLVNYNEILLECVEIRSLYWFWARLGGRVVLECFFYFSSNSVKIRTEVKNYQNLSQKIIHKIYKKEYIRGLPNTYIAQTTTNLAYIFLVI